MWIKKQVYGILFLFSILQSYSNCVREFKEKCFVMFPILNLGCLSTINVISKRKTKNSIYNAMSVYVFNMNEMNKVKYICDYIEKKRKIQ